ncbi:MAG: cytochrome c3 family protein [Acidobacteria bacterium]|nr:cytochrome c3 family protein [Acidobacteriota bacterium]
MARSARFWPVVLLGAAVCALAACERVAPIPQAPSETVFTTAHRTIGDAFNEFFGRRAEPVQPIEFPHDIHIEKGMTCTDSCHEAAVDGPVAGLPSVAMCMTCHEAIATDRPRIKTIAEAYAAKGLDLPWQRVYGFSQSAHVKFNHAPHIRAEVDCATCHGDVAKGTVARRTVDHTMGFCVGCHREKNAPNDCMTCHF